ncbi:energy transducer TonB [Ekhidna sp.]|uniref:energy transducer TonB n=1 Tax=Ekhidna sp. TaxID=2608089 RepID=UPI003BAB468C
MKSAKSIDATEGLPAETIQKLSTTNQKIIDQNKRLQIYEGLLKIKQERKTKDLAIRPMLFNIGMTLSLLFVITAINWKTYDVKGLVSLGEVESDLNEIIEIPPSSQQPPPPPKQQVFKIEEVKDTEIIEEIEMTLDVEVTENEAVEVIDFVVPEEPPEEVEEIFVIVEQEPLPKDGLDAFYAYLADELDYPSRALRLGITGSVFVEFVIEKDGRITQAQVVKGIGAGCDEEAIRVIQNAPNWTPGKQRGIPVRVRKIIPVRFMMADSN